MTEPEAGLRELSVDVTTAMLGQPLLGMPDAQGSCEHCPHRWGGHLLSLDSSTLTPGHWRAFGHWQCSVPGCACKGGTWDIDTPVNRGAAQ